VLVGEVVAVAGERPAWPGSSRIGGVEDVHRVLDAVNAAGLERAGTAVLARAVQTASESDLVDADVARVLPAVPELEQLLPWPGGLRRGRTIAAVGSTSLIITLLAGAMIGTTSWAAVIGMPGFGALAAAEAGVPLDRPWCRTRARTGPRWPPR
jgi:hypothetical protein